MMNEVQACPRAMNETALRFELAANVVQREAEIGACTRVTNQADSLLVFASQFAKDLV